MPTPTVENYLKAILHLEQAGRGPVAVGRIAAELELTPGTVTTMMKHLRAHRLVRYVPRRGVSLSDGGRAAALRVLRRHRLVELFLVEVLGLDWNEVHEEAEVLEHAISDRLLGRIDEILGHPSHDPHGAPIPDAEGRLPEQRATPLVDSPPGRYRLARVRDDEDAEFLDWLGDHGLRPGTGFELLEHDRPAGVLRLAIDGQAGEARLGTAVAGRLLVRETAG